ncbi:hypothetical protein EV702DRAFT_1077473 [Suillus placidus]|uniref:F-box domain-containing protein n=1 Tax=Suillus placidus TaxID=48579 RepID=A0A9P7D6Q9_9AGAM|nr:hypothetical protein EV702DRAFT_1077473 [Suillus placidus]
MHRALQLRDIIYTIFRHINEPSAISYHAEPSVTYDDDDDDDDDLLPPSVIYLDEPRNDGPRNNVGRMTLAALASTCRTFQEPALDLLWADLYFPYPLIRCMPDWRNRWRLDHTNALSARDWEVLQKYVPLVRTLTFLPNALDLYRYRDVLSALRQPPVAQPPLPNLQRLDYRHHVPEDGHLLDIFFVPSLTDLTIEVQHSRLPDISFISPLATLCPHLTSFRLFGYGSHEPTVATVSNIIMSLPHLQALQSDHLSQEAITFVAWHQSLAELDISITSGHPYSFPQYPHHPLPQIPPFSRIKSFAMRSTHLTAITAFIQAVQPSPSNLCITTSQGMSSEDLQEFFSILSRSFHQTLSDGFIDIGTIKPLLCFSRLRELHLLTGNSVHLSDEELAAMGASWPCLEVINFNNGKGSQPVPSSNISLRGLILLVNKTRLRRAHLMIKGDGLGLIERCPASMVGPNDFQHLVLADTTVNNPRDFALIVSLAFPKVKKIVVNPSRRRGWAKVNEYLKVFRLFQEGHWRN